MSRRLQVGSRIRSLREWRDLRQPGLADRAGLSRDTVWRVENGTRPLNVDQAHLLARALDVPVTWFFADDWTRPDGTGDTPGKGRGAQGG